MGDVSTSDGVGTGQTNGHGGYLSSRIHHTAEQEANVKSTSSQVNGAHSDAKAGRLFAPPDYANPSRKLIDRYVDEPRQLRVSVIGAGLTGVLSGILLPAKVPGIKLTIYEKNADVVSEPRKARETRSTFRD